MLLVKAKLSTLVPPLLVTPTHTFWIPLSLPSKTPLEFLSIHTEPLTVALDWRLSAKYLVWEPPRVMVPVAGFEVVQASESGTSRVSV